MAYREITRQNAVYCLERGILMERIWNGYIEAYQKQNDGTLKAIDRVKAKLKESLKENKEGYDIKLDFATKEFANLKQEIRGLKKALEEVMQDN